ncbi:MAG: carbohydrate ABC transporter permease [Bacillus subtilis]|nr:carbohydrate ABC transporter permease [Bacillus subtilis]
MVEPTVITEIVNTNYDVFGVVIDSPQLNLLISLLIGYLIVFVPTTFTHFKRLRSKDIIEMDDWTYRTQFLYMGMSFFTLNPVSAVIRGMAGTEILEVVKGYRLKEAIRLLAKSIAELFNGTTRDKVLAKRAARKQLANSQVDLDRISKRDFFAKMVGMIANYTLLTFIALFIFIPFYWMMITALKTNLELETALQPRIFIGLSEMQWVNFKVALTRFEFGVYLRNTLFVGLISMVGTVTTTILAAFAFSRLEFKGRDFIFSVLLMTMMIPGELYTITNFITINNLNWYNTYFALIFPFMTSVFYIFFLETVVQTNSRHALPRRASRRLRRLQVFDPRHDSHRQTDDYDDHDFVRDRRMGRVHLATTRRPARRSLVDLRRASIDQFHGRRRIRCPSRLQLATRGDRACHRSALDRVLLLEEIHHGRRQRKRHEGLI